MPRIVTRRAGSRKRILGSIGLKERHGNARSSTSAPVARTPIRVNILFGGVYPVFSGKSIKYVSLSPDIGGLAARMIRTLRK
jgi:hypothetical protein